MSNQTILFRTLVICFVISDARELADVIVLVAKADRLETTCARYPAVDIILQAAAMAMMKGTLCKNEHGMP